MDGDIDRILWTASEISDRVAELAAEISGDFKEHSSSFVVVGVATGAFLFLADLVRKITLPIAVDFVRVESYGSGTESSGEPKISCDVKVDVSGKHVILVEDIVDTGNTLSCLISHLQSKGASSISVCTFLDKPARRRVHFKVVGEGKFYRGFELLRHDEELHGILMKPKRPRAVVLCPTRELSEQVFRVAKSISHHARFRSTRISGGGRLRPQEDSLNGPVDMVVGTPGRLLQHIEDGNMVYGDIKYLVLDEADTMFDRGFGPDIRKFLGPLKKRAEKPGDQGFQTVLVTATMTKAVQKLVDEEFQGITHLRTSTLHKKIASARHDFIKLSGSEDKMESLLQVLEPSLAKGNRVMVFCNTLKSSRAVDHCLSEKQIYTVNYHGEVPAAERVENLKKFKSEEGDCPTLVCTDLAARGLDLDVDHVIMFDFPSNAIDYLHRTGRTARMGAKGKVTSLVAKKDLPLATRIEEAMKKNESLESLNAASIRQDAIKSRQPNQKGRDSNSIKLKTQRMTKSSKIGGKTSKVTAHKVVASIKGKRSAPSKAKAATLSKPKKSYAAGGIKRDSSKGRKSNTVKSTTSKLRVVGFRGRSSSGNRESARTA